MVLLRCSFILLLGISLFVAQMFDLRPKTVRVDRLDGKCRGIKNLKIYFKDLHTYLLNRTTMISTKIVIEKNVNRDLTLKLTITRCPSKEALDSCEIYQTITVNKMCDLMDARGRQPWSPLLKTVKPEIRCPLKRGVYVAENGTFDGSAFSAFPVIGWYWKVTAKVFEQNTDILDMCVYLEGQIIPV